MKLGNAIVALGLVIALTFGMNISTATAHVLEPVKVEKVDGVIEELSMGRSSLRMKVTCIVGSQLSIYSTTGQLVYQSIVSTGDVAISTADWGTGNFVVVLTESNEQTVKVVVKN